MGARLVRKSESAGVVDGSRPRQSCAVPFRMRGKRIELCLVTSMGKKHWIFPKGGIEAHEKDRAAALKEAYEEAGVKGVLIGKPLGVYRELKWGVAHEVMVYLMEVERSLKHWPEQRRRKRCFVSLPKARTLVRKPALREILEIVEKRFDL